MKSCFIVSVLLVAVLASLSSIEPVQFAVVQTFPSGSGEGMFGYTSAPQIGDTTSVPRAFAYQPPYFVVGDSVNERIVSFTADGQWYATAGRMHFGLRAIVDEKYAFLLGDLQTYHIVDYKNATLVKRGAFLGSFGDPSDYRRILVLGDILLAQSQNSGVSAPTYHAILFPEDFDGQIEIMNSEETIRYLKQDYDGTEEFAVDEDGYIFWNGRLVAPYGPSYFRYYYQTRENNPTVWNMLQSLRFTGWDDEGNAYWEYDSIVVVFNQAGEIIAQFLGENVSPLIRTQFAVTPEGTLYVLSYNRARDEFELMKLERFW